MVNPTCIHTQAQTETDIARLQLGKSSHMVSMFTYTLCNTLRHTWWIVAIGLVLFVLVVVNCSICLLVCLCFLLLRCVIVYFVQFLCFCVAGAGAVLE